MAWNRADTSSQSAARKTSGKSPSAVKGAIAGVVVVALAVAAYFLLFSNGPEKPKTEKVEKKPAQLAEVKPATASTQNPSETKPKPKPYWTLDTTNGLNEAQLRKWKVEHRPQAAYRAPKDWKHPKARCAIFKHRSENLIASLLTIKPGQGLVGSPNLRGIAEDFKKSCEEPILPEKDDDEYNLNLKKMMKETKVEICQQLSEGAKLEDIIMGAYKEYQKLAQYKSELNKEFHEYLKNPDHTDQDVDDFVTAANRMLAEKGIAPLTLGVITRKRIKNVKQNAKEDGK